MPFLLLLLLYLVCLGGDWPQPPGLPDNGIGRFCAVLISAAAMGLVVGAAAVAARRVRQQLRADPHQRDNVLRHYGKFRTYHALVLLAAFVAALYVFGWGWVVQSLCTVEAAGWEGGKLLLPGVELILLAPLLAGMVLSWVCYYDAERALHDSAHPLTLTRPFWARSEYVTFHVRQNLVWVLVPAANLIALQGVLHLWPNMADDGDFQLGMAVLLVVQILALPWIVRVVLGLTPLPAGPLRERLLAVAKRINFRCTDIMLWNTRQGVANALVLGVIPALRYVVLSDRLIAEMSPDEVEAVFGHEAGHVKHHHMIFYLGFLFISLTVLACAWEAVEPYLRVSAPGRTWLPPLLISSVGAYIFVVFGFLSRRCERQADIYGCRAVSCGQPDCADHSATPLPTGGHGLCPTGIRTFIGALEKVAVLNGISRSKPGWLSSWQHSTIDLRVQFLQQVAADPALEPRFQKRVGLVKWVLIIVLVCLLGLFKWSPVGVPSGNSTTTGAEQPPAALQ